MSGALLQVAGFRTIFTTDVGGEENVASDILDAVMIEAMLDGTLPMEVMVVYLDDT